MDEETFWGNLEWRICREFEGMADGRTRNFWCDGLAPSAWSLQDATPRIVGVAWVDDDANPTEWQFTLFLPGPVASQEEIDWAALLPAKDLTKWLAFDSESKRLQIEPAAALPDLD